jgi:hypothetical protein
VPSKLVVGAIESMNKQGYLMIGWLCVIVGNFLAFSGVVTNTWLTNTINREGLSDVSAFSSIYNYASILVFGGIVLIVLGVCFVWRARSLRDREKALSL